MTVVLFGALVVKLIDFLKLVVNLRANRSGVVTQLVVWAGAVGVIALAAHSALTEPLVIPGTALPLGDLDGGSVVLAGLLVGSFGSLLFNDARKAVDQSQSAAYPALLSDRPEGC